MFTAVLSLASALLLPLPGQSSGPGQGVDLAPSPIIVPAEDGFDWLQLSSGEWLKGELVRLREGTLEFDSDELGMLKLDWAKVQLLWTSDAQTVLVEDEEPFEGRLTVSEGVAVVGGPDGRRLQASELLAIVPGTSESANYWSGKVTFGLSVRQGNTNQADGTAYFFARRETASTRWDNTYNGAYGKTNGLETANNHRLSTHLDYFLTRRLYLTPFAATAYRDPFSNIDLRLTPSAGFGYDLMDRNTLSWEIDAGPAFQYTRYSSVLSNEPGEESTWAFYTGTKIEWNITPNADLTFGYELTTPVPDTDEYNHHLSTVLSVDLFELFDLDVTFTWDRVNKPPLDGNGVAAKPDDLRLSVGLGWTF